MHGETRCRLQEVDSTGTGFTGELILNYTVMLN